MKFAAVIFWWLHRRPLKAQGYSLVSFCALTAKFMTSLLGGTAIEVRAQKPGMAGAGDGFSRRDLRVRW
jgi:hypothetical protein